MLSSIHRRGWTEGRGSAPRSTGWGCWPRWRTSRRGHPPGELGGGLEDQVLVVVLRGDVIAAFQRDALDRAAVVRGQDVAVTQIDDVVLRRCQQQQRHVHRRELVAEWRDSVEQHRDERLE